MEDRVNPKTSFIDRIYYPTLWILSLILVALLTFLSVRLYDKYKDKQAAKNSFLRSQLSMVKQNAYLLNYPVDRDIASKDPYVLDYSKSIIQNLEEFRVLSPFEEVRDAASELQNRYFELLPAIRDSVQRLDFKSGDIIVRHNNDFHSELFRKMSVNEQKYSHLGIIEFRNSDSILVHHSVANDFTGIGGVTTDFIYGFMPKGDFDMAVYRVSDDPQIREDILENLLDVKRRGVPFDPFFDISDTTKLYCAEMVAHVVNEAVREGLITPSGNFLGKSIYTIEDCYTFAGSRLMYKREGTTKN